jgi:hypothetical protein
MNRVKKRQPKESAEPQDEYVEKTEYMRFTAGLEELLDSAGRGTGSGGRITERGKTQQEE